MYRILHISDSTDPLAKKVRSIAGGQLEIDTVAGDRVPASLDGCEALLIGDGSLNKPLTEIGEGGPKFVQLTRGHHRDVDAASLITSGITVAGASPVLAPYVARHALKLVQSATDDSSPDVQQPSLDGKTVGIIGFGRVGRAMAELCKLVGATVIYADVRTAPHGSAAAVGVRRSTLDLLLSKSDIVSLHVQWGPTSNPLLSERELRLVGQGGVLVNTADARLVDEGALAEAVGAGRIKAALDIEDGAGVQGAGIVSTPYIAARSEEADENVAEFVVGNILSALSGPQSGNTPNGQIEIIDFPRAGDPAFWSSKMSPREV